jgi:aminoglycoside 3-N-acetyltransferase
VVDLAITTDDLRAGIRSVSLSGIPLCVHSSLRSFGYVKGGAQAIVESLLAEACTVLVPTFSSEAYEVPPPPGVQLARNGLGGDEPKGAMLGVERRYTPDSSEIDADMGAIPTAVLAMPGRVRSPHPIRSFAAIGSRASDLIPEDATVDLFEPLKKLAEVDGSVLLMGVGLDKTTAIHLAEQEAGRHMFRRWANGLDRRPVGMETGGCSNGFVRLESVLKPLERVTRVGQSVWCAYPAGELLEAATRAIWEEPSLTHCSDPQCIRCDDAIMGGPVPLTSEDA